MAEVILKSLIDGVYEGTINTWFYEEGDRVEEGADLVEISSETGSLKITAPHSGVLGEVYFAEGETVNVGDVLCDIESQ